MEREIHFLSRSNLHLVKNPLFLQIHVRRSFKQLYKLLAFHQSFRPKERDIDRTVSNEKVCFQVVYHSLRTYRAACPQMQATNTPH